MCGYRAHYLLIGIWFGKTDLYFDKVIPAKGYRERPRSERRSKVGKENKNDIKGEGRTTSEEEEEDVRKKARGRMRRRNHSTSILSSISGSWSKIRSDSFNPYYIRQDVRVTSRPLSSSDRLAD